MSKKPKKYRQNDNSRPIFEREMTLESLQSMGNPLEILKDLLDFELFRPLLEPVFEKADRKSNAGRKPIDPVLMFKVMFLQRLYGLGDHQIEYQIKDRTSFREFLDIVTVDDVPDEKTVWKYKEMLSQDGTFDRLQFNMNLAANRFQYGGRRLAIAIDPSYVSKAGKKTAHVGRFWSGCASAVKHGLEILGVGLIDADLKDCIMLRAVQTLNSPELKAGEMTLNQWYISVIKRYSAQLLKITGTLVADAAFSVKSFVDELLPTGFNLVSRLRNDAVLYYLYQGERKVGPGRPKTLDGKIDFSNLDTGRMTQVDIGVEGERAYELVARSKALKRNIKLVIHILKDGSHRLYFSTDTAMRGIDVFDIYRTRFQIEFCYRDGHQFTGLRDCQARDEKRLDFAFNASFAAVNVIKVMRKEFKLDFSIGQIKSLMVSVLSFLKNNGSQYERPTGE